MSENEEKQEGELDTEIVEEEVVEEKPKLTPDQLKAIRQREFTKLKKEFEPVKTEPEALKGNNKDFDYAEKAFLKASGIDREDFDFVREVADNTGKSIDEVIESKYFKAELKERKELRTSAEALPTATKRSGQSAKDTVDYWLAKDINELPPVGQTKLRREVIKARAKRDTDSNKFTDHSVV
jgi:hypothetical protein